MKPSAWPDWLEEVIWAKSKERSEDGQGEGLATHTWQVLERLADVIHMRPDLPAALGLPRLWHCLFWACFLHDWGKAAQGFQDRLRGGPRWPYRHEVISLAFVDWVSTAFSDDEASWLVAAIASHHRDANEIEAEYPPPLEDDDDFLNALVAEIREDTLGGLWRWLSQCPGVWISELGLGQAGIVLPVLPPQAQAVVNIRLHGAARIRDRLRIYCRFVQRVGRSHERSLAVGTLALRGYMIGSDHMASAHTDALAIPDLQDPADLLARLNLPEHALYAHQRACAKTRGSAVLMAPTGSGKTEAALLWACAQAPEGRPVSRLFYTLPYQASMNAMYDRLSRGFPHQVGLEHSRSTLALYRRFLDQDYTPAQAARAAKWGKNLAQLTYFPIRVLSPYQILKAAYRLKGYECLLSDYFGAVFILDEVHAYDAERLAMILGMVKYLAESFGARFFVMSATLPTLLQERLMAALGSYAAVRATPELFARFRRHTLLLRDGDLLTEPNLTRMAEVARSGQSVLICCNTVGRAQTAYDQMRSCLQGTAELVLLHGRFNGRDRLAKELAIRDAAGSRSRNRRPVVLVATQVVEVSLDIDLDIIYTDPAPLEALIQRFGRVNRRLLREAAPVCVFREPADGQRVYEAELVQGALGVLEPHDGQMIDEARIGDWLDAVYQGEIAARWHKRYDDAYREFQESCLACLRAFNSDDSLQDLFFRAFDSIEVLPASLESEYVRLVDDEPLAAGQLLVPVRYGQFVGLRARGKISQTKDGVYVVDAPYSSERGLLLAAPP
jgi:CRISPR-associated endonuclease/helicase Cas3